MSSSNTPLLSALEKLNIPFHDHVNHPYFKALSPIREDSVWNEVNRCFELTPFELGALKNARCSGGLDLVKMSRLELLDKMEYDTDLDKLLDLIEKAALPEPKASIIEQYCEGRHIGDSEAYALTEEHRSTVASKGQYDMSNFDISSLHGTHQVSVTMVRLNNERQRTFIADRLFNGSIDALDQSLAELTPVLRHLRSHFVYLREKIFFYTEASYFQPLYTLFLERVASRIGRSTCNMLGSVFPLSMEADVVLDNGHIDTVIISGKTDIVKVPTFDVDDDYDAIEFLMELKPPFGALYHALSAEEPKGQLVSQLLGLWSSSSAHRMVALGGLSDIFALVIGFACADRKREFSMTTSVVREQEYLLHLLLLFCCPHDYDLRGLVESESSSMSNLNEEGSHEKNNPFKSFDRDPDAGNGDRATGVASVHSGGTAGVPTKSKTVCHATEDEYEAAWEAEMELHRWYARHHGLRSLTKETLARCCSDEV